MCEKWEGINVSHPSLCLGVAGTGLDPSAGFVIARADGSGAELVKAGILVAESF